MELDGGPAVVRGGRLSTLGWAARRTCHLPSETFFELEGALAPGEHTIQVRICGDGGSWENASNKMIPVLDGEVSSAPVTFLVR